MGHGAWRTSCRLLTAPMSEHSKRFTALCPFRCLSVKYYIDVLDSAYLQRDRDRETGREREREAEQHFHVYILNTSGMAGCRVEGGRDRGIPMCVFLAFCFDLLHFIFMQNDVKSNTLTAA